MKNGWYGTSRGLYSAVGNKGATTSKTRMVQLPATAAIEYVAACWVSGAGWIFVPGCFCPGGLLPGGTFSPGVFGPGALLAGGLLAEGIFVRGCFCNRMQ